MDSSTIKQIAAACQSARLNHEETLLYFNSGMTIPPDEWVQSLAGDRSVEDYQKLMGSDSGSRHGVVDIFKD